MPLRLAEVPKVASVHKLNKWLIKIFVHVSSSTKWCSA